MIMDRHFRASMFSNVVTLAVVLMTLSFVTMAQNARATSETERSRIERLAGLAKVWGAVKYFHPYLAYRDIDWDKALVETVPSVNSAGTGQEYADAINRMLASLNDRNTYAALANAAPPVQNAPSSDREFMRLENGILFIEPSLAASYREREPDNYYVTLQKNSSLIGQATSIVIDARGVPPVRSDSFDYYFEDLLKSMLTQILDRTVAMGTYRYRMHSGNAPQVGISTGGYFSALVNGTPESIAGQNKKAMLPTVMIFDDRFPLSASLLSGLQAGNKIRLVQDGEGSFEVGMPYFEIKLPENVSVRMRTAELVGPDGSIGFQPDVVVPKTTGEDRAMSEALKLLTDKQTRPVRDRSTTPSVQIPAKDKTYPEMEFPSSEFRLLALFRFWNVINYLYPYKDLIGGDWNDVLVRYIPKFEADKDAFDYQMTVREMVTEIHDSHGFVRGTRKVDERLGNFVVPVMTSYIEGQSVVTNVLDDKLGVRAGDIVLAIDGEPFEKRREYFSRLFTASTPQSFNSKTTSFHLMRRPSSSSAKLTVKGADGKIRDVEVTNLPSIRDPKTDPLFRRTTPVFQVLPSGFGYVDLDRLTVTDVDKMFDTIKNTPATIFDMRGYPNGTGTEIAPRLTTRRNVIGALFSRPMVEATGLGVEWLADPAYTFAEPMPAPKGDVYKGKVVMLIDGNAGSQAEHTCLFFEAATDVTFIGTPTSGVNGDVTNIVLPGNIVVSFSGQGVRHADGRQLQRIGIQPTIKVEPTIRGIREGRDEILDAAVKFLKSNKAAQIGKK